MNQRDLVLRAEEHKPSSADRVDASRAGISSDPLGADFAEIKAAERAASHEEPFINRRVAAEDVSHTGFELEDRLSSQKVLVDGKEDRILGRRRRKVERSAQGSDLVNAQFQSAASGRAGDRAQCGAGEAQPQRGEIVRAGSVEHIRRGRRIDVVQLDALESAVGGDVPDVAEPPAETGCQPHPLFVVLPEPTIPKRSAHAKRVIGVEEVWLGQADYILEQFSARPERHREALSGAAEGPAAEKLAQRFG